ncbi:DUF1995 family protein [filamentous cyanobacterium LEGE 11480]|uniref:DUF1995 family protein n=1 Tax=Romeriopsis navalis LEGE 11480 TaxID=2777977 RepID=A0A928VNQ3_9CYAN|nr:DUF1995 family protein [Romeriopsis navalis]MBE9029339.1 DUF1995 family protein [Romeriopsis navalis LEGE 11480]
MTQLPNTLEEAIVQAQAASQAAIEAGYSRIGVELLFPELKAMPVAQQFAEAFVQYGEGLKIFFTDAGTAAWAKKNWDTTGVKFGSVDVAGQRQTSDVDEQVEPTDRLYIFVAPTSVEVGAVEQICDAAGDRPVILLNPRLEDVSIIGIGYAGRQLRERFLVTIEPAYYLRPLDDTTALMRNYPTPWQLWCQQAAEWSVIAEERERPDSERIDALLLAATGEQKPKSAGFLAQIGSFINALNR